MPSDFEKLFSRPISEEDLRAARRGKTFHGEASEDERAAIAKTHGLSSVRELSYELHLEPYAAKGWRLQGRVRADVDQICVVSLEPAPRQLDESVLRLWADDAPEDAADSSFAAGMTDWAEEIPELASSTQHTQTTDVGEEADEVFVERTPAPIDLAEIALETLTVSLPPYPRAPGAVFEETNHGPPGSAPLTDEAARPFAGLQKLREKFDQEAKQAQDTGGNDSAAASGRGDAAAAEPGAETALDAEKRKDPGENGENA